MHSWSKGNKSPLFCSSQFRKFFWLDALVPFKCQEHEVMLASINLVLGGMTVLMGKADKHQSVSMGVNCNINTLFLNGQNENMNAQVWKFLRVNNGMCIPIHIYIHIQMHFVHSMVLRECILIRNPAAVFVLVLAASWAKIKINDQHEVLRLKWSHSSPDWQGTLHKA